MSGSLRRRLVLSLCGSMVAAWMATAYFTYHDTRILIDEVVDVHLKQSADMMADFLDRLSATASFPSEGLLIESDRAQPLSFHIRTRPRGVAAPADAGNGQAGYSDIVKNGDSWRVYRAAAGADTLVEVAVRQEVRTSFAARVATHILHPVWIAVPLLAVLIWGFVRWGLQPLDRVTEGVKRRSAADLSPLRPETAPVEVLPLVGALNALFLRIAAARERDRHFAADAAHELRTPLAAIRANAQVARLATETDQRQQAIADVLIGVDRGTRVVEQLLALARVEHNSEGAASQPVDLAALARDTLVALAPQAAARDIDLGLEVEPGFETTVRGNADLLGAMVRNLVDNALRYIPEGGRVTVHLARRDDVLVLRVEDTGPGIAPELRARALDRFFRVAGSGAEGSGLGLSIVAAIVESHGGTFTLGDRPDGQGLCAEATLPMWAADH
ncbi:MAG TPA: ATP-binding protein [Mycoplana sp.]|nr:ATP-binding protein [Mycoplana sp.]